MNGPVFHHELSILEAAFAVYAAAIAGAGILCMRVKEFFRRKRDSKDTDR